MGLLFAACRHDHIPQRPPGGDGVERPTGDQNEVEQALFRIAQEALANAARHSGAARVSLLLNIDDGENPEVRLEVRDDGDGFDTEAARSAGFGLRSMEERMAVVGGSLEVESGSDGSRVVACCHAERKIQ